MDRIRSCDVDINLREMPIRTGRENLLYKTNDGQILKVFSKRLIDEGKDVLEKKLSNPRKIEGVVGPNQIVCIHDDIAGYTMNYVNGKHILECEKALAPESRNDLTRIAERYLELERLVRNAGDDVVFPELRDKVFVTDKGETKIIGYDYIQIGDMKSLSWPRAYGSLSKYLKGDGMYTKDVDVSTLIWFYLKMAFDLDLVNFDLNTNDPLQHAKELLESVKMPLVLTEKILLLYRADKNNEYLGDIVLEIADKYRLVVNNKNIYYPASKILVNK